MLQNDLFLRTLRGELTERPPVWFMRQAGRYLPDYMKLKEKYSFFERVRQPELAAQITAMPVEQIGVDAAILFSDILVIAQALGMEVTLLDGKGPQLPQPVRTRADVAQLDASRTEAELDYAGPAIRSVKQALSNQVPLIGFCGSPWTLFCYMMEGKGSKDFSTAKQFCAQEPALAHELLDKITDASIRYLKMQIEAGVDAIQIFDSWGGLLSPEWYQTFSLAYLEKITREIKSQVPVILFAKGAWYALEGLQKTGAAALGLDWTINASFARKACGEGMVFQGNLDPSILLAKPETVAIETKKMIDSFKGKHHIVNLGHGVLPQTKVDSARAFVDTAKAYRYGNSSAV